MKPALLLFAAAAICAAQDPYTQSRADGPTALIITYRCNPDQRTTLRDRMVRAAGVARFESWKKDGILKDYHILFNSYLDSETYDMMALLTFEKYADVARWREVEKEMPGGLSRDTLPLITSGGDLRDRLGTFRHVQEPCHAREERVVPDPLRITWSPPTTT